MDVKIEQYISAKLESIDISHIVEQAVREQVKPIIDDEANKIVREKVNQLVTEEIEKFMTGEVVIEKDWHEKERYPTFERYLSKKFQDSLNNSYNIKREFERTIESKINQMYGDTVKKVQDALMDEIKNKIFK